MDAATIATRLARIAAAKAAARVTMVDFRRATEDRRAAVQAMFARGGGGGRKAATKKAKGASRTGKASGPCGANKAGGGGFLEGNTCALGGKAGAKATTAKATTTVKAQVAAAKKEATAKAGEVKAQAAAKAREAKAVEKAKVVAAKKEAAEKVKAEKAAAVAKVRAEKAEARVKAAAAKKEATARVRAEKAAAAKAEKAKAAVAKKEATAKARAEKAAEKAKAAAAKKEATAKAREVAKQNAKESRERLRAEKKATGKATAKTASKSAAEKAADGAKGRDKSKAKGSGEKIKTASIETVRAAMTDPKTGKLYKTLDERYDAAETFIATNQSKVKVPVKAHGMTEAEEMHSLRIGDHEYRYASNDLIAGDGRVIPGRGVMSATLVDLATDPLGPIPSSLAKHTKNIIFTSQRNKDDGHWEQAYNKAGFRATATGGDGNVVVYNGDAIGRGTLAHEMGHNLATARYGQTDPTTAKGPKGTSDYAAAAKSGEKPVSDYAKNSPAEDFAEAARVYAQNPADLKANHPRRFAVIDRLMKDSDYEG